MANTLTPAALTAAVVKGIVEGTDHIIQQIAEQADKRHDLRNTIQINVDKVHDLDSEVKLLKGYVYSLVGQGDGSTGLVPRVENEMRELKEDVSTLKSNVGTIMSDIKAMKDSQSKSTSFMDGWKGISVALGVIGTCITIMAGVVGVLAYLYTHGGSH